MSGVRVQHPTERNVMFTLVDQSRPYREPFVCTICSTTHLFKTYHFRLDEAGACIVSTEIANRLKRLPRQGGFDLTNEVAAPPSQKIIPGIVDRLPIIAHTELKEPT